MTTEATDIVILDEDRPAPKRTTKRASVPAVVDNSPMGRMIAALDRGVKPEQISQMMDLQARWEADEARKAYNEAMALFKAEAVEIIKRREVDFTNQAGRRTHYKHAELADVIEAVGPALSKHGFSWSWTPKQEKGWIEVTCTLKHRLGHSESVTLGAPPDDSGGKNTIQQIMSTKTYLERHTLKAICGVAEKGEDDDGHGAGKKGPEIPAELLQLAREEAMNGWKSFSAWIKGRTEEERLLLEPESASLKQAAREADAKGGAQ